MWGIQFWYNFKLSEIQAGIRSDFLQIGELLHQLLHAMASEEDGELGVLALAFAHEHSALAVLGVADALAFLEIGGAAGAGQAYRRG